jgi:ribosomal protein S12 methylthiotransferase
LLRVMAERPNVCNYFDIPLQHASRRVLKRMRRGGDRQSYQRLIERIRERVPGVAIRTTFIVGFPGEREEDFEELVDFVRAAEFDRVGVGTITVRWVDKNSPAFELDEKVDPAIARKRERRLMKVQAQVSRRKHRRLVGTRQRVLLEGRAKESDLLLEGRLGTQAPEIDGAILINDVPEGCEVRPGDFVTVEITEAHDYDLVGRVVEI